MKANTDNRTKAGTQVKPYSFEFYPQQPDFPRERLTVLYHFRTEEAELRDMLPTVGGQFLLFLRGSGTLNYADGSVAESSLAFFITPMTKAAEYRLSGPLHAVGVGLTELGWAELTGLCVDQHGNSTFPAEQIFGDEVLAFAQRIVSSYNAGSISPGEIATEMVRFIETRFSEMGERRRKFITTVRRWVTSDLNPNLADLYAELAYSPRQVQRLTKRYFGLAPKSLLRRFRAVMAASLVSHDKVTPVIDAKIGEAFYDQSHMINDFGKYAGRAPTRLGPPRQSVLSDIMEPDHYLSAMPFHDIRANLDADDPGGSKPQSPARPSAAAKKRRGDTKTA